MRKFIILPLAVLFACTETAPMSPSAAEIPERPVMVMAEIGLEICENSPPDPDLNGSETEQNYENVPPSYMQWCAWPAEITDDKPADYVIVTGIEARGNVVHTIHWYIHGELSENPYRSVNTACWENGSDAQSTGEPWPKDWNWERDNFCQLEITGDVTIEVMVGWPPCPVISGSVSLREVKPGRRANSAVEGSRAQERICGLTPAPAPLGLLTLTEAEAWADSNTALSHFETKNREINGVEYARVLMFYSDVECPSKYRFRFEKYTGAGHNNTTLPLKKRNGCLYRKNQSQ